MHTNGTEYLVEIAGHDRRYHPRSLMNMLAQRRRLHSKHIGPIPAVDIVVNLWRAA